jgi:glycosyltransferase involved in cell wall biosynthesis
MLDQLLPVSVCIPVRNEESHIAACLDSLRGCFDDIVVVDSGSTDSTCRIATDRNARVVSFQWDGRFPKKRNWALRTVPFRHDWILFLDADERLTEAFLAELERTLRGCPHAGFWLSYTNHFMGRELKHGDRLRKLALFRRAAGEYEAFPENLWTGLDMEIHEHPVLNGSVGRIAAPIDHRDDRGLHHYIAKHNEYSSWEANRFAWLASQGPDASAKLGRRQAFKYRNLDKWWLGHLYFWACVLLKRGFLDGIAGWRFAALKRRYFNDIRLKILEARERTRPAASAPKQNASSRSSLGQPFPRHTTRGLAAAKHHGRVDGS